MTAPVATAASYYALDAAYRAAVAETSRGVLRLLARWWVTVDPQDLAGTSARWVDGSVLAILAGQKQTVELANAYADQVRRLSIPGATPFTPPVPTPFNPEQIRKSIIFTGISQTAREVAALESSVRDVEKEEAESAQRTVEGRRRQLMQDGLARAAGSAIRLVNDAGQQQIEDYVRADDLALGWARTTKPGCCYFCAMLASRGYVYKEDSFAESDPRFTGPGSHKVHDNCGCGLRPFYDPAEPLPDRTEALEQLWAAEAARFSGPAAVKAFRKAYEASPLAQPALAA